MRKTIRCIVCKENDSWFSRWYTEQGKKDMVEHMNEEHGYNLTLDVFDD